MVAVTSSGTSSMADFITPIIELVKEFWPVRVVQVDEQGVRKWGNKATLCLPRKLPYLFFPGIQVFEKYHVMYQGVDCGTQTVDLPNDQVAIFSVNVSYMVMNALKASTEFENLDGTIEREARGFLASAFLHADDQEDGSDVDPLEVAEQARRFLQALFTDALDIRAITYTTFTRKARVYRVFNGAEG